MSTKNNISKTAFYSNSQKKTTYTDKKINTYLNKSKPTINQKSEKEETQTQFYPALNIEEKKLDSKMLSQPILNVSNYKKALESEFPPSSKEKMRVKLLQYNIIKESLDQCSSFPSNIRKYIYQFLFSLPNDKNIFSKYDKMGIHPFFRFLDDIYPLADNTQKVNLQKVCSLLAFYSPLIGNIYFLPELVFPFIKCFPNEEHFLFELLIAFFHSIGNFWFEFYPGMPLYHIKLSEKIIEHEDSLLYDHIEKIYRESDIAQLKLTEIIWRLIRNLFSESLIKDHWLQMIDFLFAYNHKPEMILYIASAFILSIKNEIMTSSNSDEIKSVLFDTNNYTKLTNIFKKAKELYKKYNKYQIYKYIPYYPIYTEYSNDYNKLPDNYFPDDYKENVDNIKDEMMRINKEYDEKDIHLERTDKYYKDLLRKEKEAQRKFLSELNKENMKEYIIKKELDIALLHKMRFNEELAKKKINKLDEINDTIKNTVNIFNNLSEAEVKRVQQEMEHKKLYENIVLNQRILHEQINKYDRECNKGIEKLQNLRKMKEEMGEVSNPDLKNSMNEVKRTMKYMNDYYKDFEQHDKDNMNNENYFYKKNIYSDKNNINEINNNENTINQIQNFENNYNNVNQNNMIDGNDLSINDKDYINPNYIMGDNNNMNNEIGYPNQKQENNIMMEEA
jgi:hypothetical protein